MAKKNPISMSIIKCQAQLTSPKHTFISIFLLEESKNPQSPWKLYIDLLPEDHSSFPINYTKEELSELIGSPFLFMIHEKVLDLKKDYDLVIKCDKNFEKYSFKEFCWARMMVGSRIFGLNITGVKTEVLVPFADMLNHKLPKQTVWNYVDGMNGFIIESQEEVEVGE
jgi:histone-lysine N-methyltransferase SETD3